MSHYTVTLLVPDHIYDRARRIAEGTSQSIEAVLLQQLQDAASPCQTWRLMNNVSLRH